MPPQAPPPPPPPPVVPYAECDAGQQCGASLMAIQPEECPTLDANNDVVDADGRANYPSSCQEYASHDHQYGSIHYLLVGRRR